MHPALSPSLAARTATLLLALAPLAARANPSDLLPATGPHGSVAVPFAPAVPGAAEAAAAAYLRPDGRLLGALLAAVPGPDFAPEAALAAFAGGTPGASRTVLLRGHPFALVTVARAGAAPAFAVGFAVTHAANRLVVNPTEGAVHVVAWSASEEGAVALAAAALDHLSAAASLALAQDAPAVSAVSAAPNPSAGATALRFTLSAPADVRVAVYDALGRRVALLTPGRLGAGSHVLPIEADALAPGAYVARLTAGAAAATVRLTRR